MEVIKVITPISNNIVMPSCTITEILCNGIVLSSSEYAHQNNIIVIDEKYIGEKLIIKFTSDKKKFIGYTEKDSVYTYFGNTELKVNSEYNLSFTVDDSQHDYTVKTSLNPLLCSTKDVNILISPIVNIMNNELDLEYEIFEVSLDITENILNSENLSDEYSDSTVKKLAANMVAYNIVYKYYYSILDEIGSNETTVGTLSEKRSRYAINLDDLLRRFQRNIDSLEEQLIGTRVPSQSFTKAKNSTTGLNTRLW